MTCYNEYLHQLFPKYQAVCTSNLTPVMEAIFSTWWGLEEDDILHQLATKEPPQIHPACHDLGGVQLLPDPATALPMSCYYAMQFMVMKALADQFPVGEKKLLANVSWFQTPAFNIKSTLQNQLPKEALWQLPDHVILPEDFEAKQHYLASLREASKSPATSSQGMGQLPATHTPPSQQPQPHPKYEHRHILKSTKDAAQPSRKFT